MSLVGGVARVKGLYGRSLSVVSSSCSMLSSSHKQQSLPLLKKPRQKRVQANLGYPHQSSKRRGRRRGAKRTTSLVGEKKRSSTRTTFSTLSSPAASCQKPKASFCTYTAECTFVRSLLIIWVNSALLASRRLGLQSTPSRIRITPRRWALFRAMVNLLKSIWLLVSSLHIPGLTSIHEIPRQQLTPKSIVVIGAGSAGLGVLKALQSLPSETWSSWNVTLYEQREDVAGIWLPDPRPASPPSIPHTPLYPLLHTNTPVPMMTYPNFPFTPGTPLYPSHEHLLAYHQQYASQNDLHRYIRYNHKVVSTSWVGSPTRGFWNITVLDSRNRTLLARADHLIVASGNNHLPRTPSWLGQEQWLEAGNGGREILHSVYYREAGRYNNRTLLIIGAGASGQDAAVQTVGLTRRTYISVRHTVDLPPGSDNVVIKPGISHFSEQGIHFVDGSELTDIDSVLLATGYQQRKPFLESGGALLYDPSANDNSSSSSRGGKLVTNSYYIFPLHQHIFSLSPEYPVNALAFVGLPTRIANCPSDFAQGLFAAQIIDKPWILPPREELLVELAEREDNTRKTGLDPYVIGHAMLPDRASSSDYQDELVDFLKQKKAIPDDGRKFVEEWRRLIWTYDYLKRGWKRIEALGKADDWVKDVSTEEEWADLMYRVNAWQEQWENENGITFIDDVLHS